MGFSGSMHAHIHIAVIAQPPFMVQVERIGAHWTVAGITMAVGGP